MESVTNMSDIDQIRALKARYCRLIDTKAWDDFRKLFTDSMTFYRDDAAVPMSTVPVTASADAFVDRIAVWLATAVTVHQVTSAEIDVETSDHASGVWAMFDWVDNPQFGIAYRGFGHYHERYEKGGDARWRIAELRLTRLRIDPLPPTRASEIRDAKRAWLERRAQRQV